MHTLHIDDFTRRLRSIPGPDFTIPGVHAFLQQNAVDPESLSPYLVWDRRHYTRNLIDRTSLYELLAICWEVGQGSPIHNHDGQNCWMAIPVGQLVATWSRTSEIIRS
jgi:cysteine dioxygenase